LEFILIALYTFLVLGLTEAFIKPLAKRWVQRRLLAATPAVLEKLDKALPQMTLNLTGAELESEVRSMFEQVTGEDWSQADMNPFFELFDIRIAADHLVPTD
jgi:hypothetical protein